MKNQMRILCALSLVLLLGCSIQEDENAGVSITGNTGKISGTVVNFDQPKSLSKLAVEGVSEEMVVILEEETAEFSPETLQVIEAEPFLFDSLPDGNYQVRLERNDTTLAQVDSILIEDGSKVGVALYYGNEAPPSSWEPLKKSLVKFQFPKVEKAKLYVISELGEEVYSKNVDSKSSAEMELMEGNYRVFLYSDLPIGQGTASDFEFFQAYGGNPIDVSLPTISLFKELMDTAQFYPRAATVSDNRIVWEGLQVTPQYISFGTIKKLSLRSVKSDGDYSKETIYAKWTYGLMPDLLIAEDGMGVAISESSVKKVVLSRLDQTGIRMTIDKEGGFDALTRKDLADYPVGKMQLPASLNMVVEWDEDTILNVNEESVYSWNAIPAMFCKGSFPTPVPTLPDHAGLWLRYTFNGFNEDGDPWSVETVWADEMRIVNYPHTGDIRTGLRRVQKEGDDLFGNLPKGTYSGKLIFQDSTVKVTLIVNVPYYEATIDD